MPAQPNALHQLHFEAIGTTWAIDIYEPVTPSRWTKITRAIHQRIEQFDVHYSRFRPDSLVSAMAHAAGTYELPPDAGPLFDTYRDLYVQTAGVITPLIGQVLVDAGYDATYSLRPGELNEPPPWDEILTYDYPYLTLSKPALLDLGAAGKGYLVDLVSELLQNHGITAYCVDAGGDLRYRHPFGPPLQIGLEHPGDPEQIIGIAELLGTSRRGTLQDQSLGTFSSSDLAKATSLCGSAGNRRTWGKYHHIIDPFTLSSPQDIQAVWVVADTTMLADGLATALFLVEPAVLSDYYKFEYALVRGDGSLEWSRAFPASFFN